MGKTTCDLNNGPISLTNIRNLLKKNRFSALLVRSTDQYFNEYVPKDLSVRAKLTGFDGSVGDALITTCGAHLFIDGRYTLQAKTQAPDFSIHVCQNAETIESAWLNKLAELLSPNDVLAYDPATIDLRLFDRLCLQASKIDAQLAPAGADIVSEAIGKTLKLNCAIPTSITKVDTNLCGKTRQQKLKTLASIMQARGIDGFLTVKLDDIAWISNLRSYHFPYQSSVPGIACILPDSILFGTDSANHSQLVGEANLEVVLETELFLAIKEKFAGSRMILGIEAAETSKAHEIALRALDIELKQVDNPILSLKAIKNEKELLHMRSAFKKADHVVYQTQNFVIESFEKGKKINEGNVDDYVKSEFKTSGAKDLSFRPICASGKNGAIIHYGTPDHKENIADGALFLLDTGAYYEGGYATDLTRTFLASKKSDKALPWQKEMFTLVLKASIRGLSARLRRGSLGMQLDAIVRAPLWQAGLDFAHGTGHGVGINVHEFPPRIGPGSSTPLLEGHVFSIEPGLYFENLGGVRIENLATIVADPEHSQFVRVLPLTFCPIDERLIEEKMLDDHDRLFIDYYRKEWESHASWPSLPPLTSISFK